MKIAIDCKSLLLQDTLHYYLSNYLCDINQCDFIISDYLQKAEKPIYFLSFENQTLPFIPSQFIKNLRTFHQSLLKPNTPKDDELKAEIQHLLMEFADRFLQILKKYR